MNRTICRQVANDFHVGLTANIGDGEVILIRGEVDGRSTQNGGEFENATNLDLTRIDVEDNAARVEGETA